MNRIDFGKLIASLRKEHSDEDGRPWRHAEGKGRTLATLLDDVSRGKVLKGTCSLYRDWGF